MGWSFKNLVKFSIIGGGDMEACVLQKFKGEIDGFIISNQQVYYSCEFLLSYIAEKWEINKSFSGDFIMWFEDYLNRGLDYMSVSEIENSILEEIDKVENFEDVNFPYFPELYFQKLKSGKYSCMKEDK